MDTSAPETTVSISCALAGAADIAVGSNIFNILFVLGTSALITVRLIAYLRNNHI